MRTIYFDFETFYDVKAKYSLKHMTVQQYVRDPRFKVLGMSVAEGSGETRWLEGHLACQEFFDSLPKEGVMLVAHNATFDATVAHRIFGYEAEKYCCTMFMARYLISQGVIDHLSGTALKDLAPLVGDAKLNLDTALEEGTLDTYAIKDTEICQAFYEAYQSLVPAEEKQYIDMHVKMSAIPQFALDEEQLREVTTVDEKRKEMYPAVRKDETLIKALEDRGVTVQYKRMKLGEKPCFAKSDEFMQSLVKHADPVVRYLAELRLESKSTCAVSKAQRFLDCGSPMSCPIIYYGAACLTGDAEVLTRTGWQRLDTWAGGDILQVDESGAGSFLPATLYEGPPVNDWLQCTHPYMPALFTSGHTIPIRNRDGSLRGEDCLTVSKKVQRPVKVACNYSGEGSITPEQMRVLVMVQADGHYEVNSAYGRALFIHVKKDRKKARCRELLQKAGVRYEEQQYACRPDYTRFKVCYRDYPEWLTPERKYFGTWLLDSTAEAREAFFDELFLWDGYVSPFEKSYCSTVEGNAEWVSVMAHLCGRSATVRVKAPHRPRQSPCYEVTVRGRDYIVLQRRPWEDSRKPRLTFCAQTQTGYFLARYNGRIFVTGNTGRSAGSDSMNVQNMPRGSKVRTSLMAKPGKKLIIIDSSQIEVRTLGFLADDQSILDIFRRGGDIYREFAGNNLYNKKPEDVTKDERQVAKAAVLALGFGQGVQGFIAYAERMGIKITEEEAQHAVTIYRQSFPKITGGRARRGGLWQKAWEQVLLNGYSVLPSGRKLMYPNMAREGEEIYYDRHSIFAKVKGRTKLWSGLVIENITQATARDIIFTQVASVLNKYPEVDLCLMVHDESIFSVPEHMAQEVYEFADQAFKTPPAWAQGMPLNGEGHISDRYDK